MMEGQGETQHRAYCLSRQGNEDDHLLRQQPMQGLDLGLESVVLHVGRGRGRRVSLKWSKVLIWASGRLRGNEIHVKPLVEFPEAKNFQSLLNFFVATREPIPKRRQSQDPNNIALSLGICWGFSSGGSKEHQYLNQDPKHPQLLCL